MKKVINFFLLAMVFAGVSNAQTSQGTLFFGGGFNYSSQKQETPADDAKSNQFSLTPSGGYFISDNLAVGLNLNLSTSKAPDDDKTNSFNLGPFARYYKFLEEGKFAIYGEAGLLFGFGKTDPAAPGANEIKTGSTTFYVSPGFAYFFSPKWSLDLQLSGLSFSSVDPDKNADNNKRTNFNFGVNSFNPTLGFRYFLSK